MYNKRKEEITFTLPDYIISEVDHIVKMENSNRADFSIFFFPVLYNSKKENRF